MDIAVAVKEPDAVIDAFPVATTSADTFASDARSEVPGGLARFENRVELAVSVMLPPVRVAPVDVDQRATIACDPVSGAPACPDYLPR